MDKQFNNYNSLVNQILDERFGKIPASILAAILLAGSGVEAKTAMTSIYSTPKTTQKVNSPINTYLLQKIKNILTVHEGKRNSVYIIDGKRHIGIGYNLENPAAKKDLKSLGMDINAIFKGQRISDTQIEKLFILSLNRAIQIAQRIVPNFDHQPDKAKLVLIDMIFNMGEGKIMGFKKFLAAINIQDYKTAVKEMIDSKWYRNTGRRPLNLVDILSRGLDAGRYSESDFVSNPVSKPITLAKVSNFKESFQLDKIKSLKKKVKPEIITKKSVRYTPVNSRRSAIQNGPDKVGLGRGLNATI